MPDKISLAICQTKSGAVGFIDRLDPLAWLIKVKLVVEAGQIRAGLLWITLFGSGGNFAAAIVRRAVSSAHRLWVLDTTFTLWGWPCLSSWNVHFMDMR
jgi:hypothetical protein